MGGLKSSTHDTRLRSYFADQKSEVFQVGIQFGKQSHQNTILTNTKYKLGIHVFVTIHPTLANLSYNLKEY